MHMAAQGARVGSLLLVVALLAGCASSSGEGTQRTTTSEISRDEMAELSGYNLYEVVDRLRPRWLHSRAVMGLGGPGQILVYMNRSYLGGPESLRELGISGVHRIRYLDGPRAAATLSGYPSDVHVAGAIVVETSPNG